MSFFFSLLFIESGNAKARGRLGPSAPHFHRAGEGMRSQEVPLFRLMNFLNEISIFTVEMCKI